MAPLVRALRDILIALSLLGGAPAAVAAETADRPVYISIPAGSLADALDRLGDQSGVQIMYEPAMAEGIEVTAVNGTLTVRDALTQLLARTGLRADRVNDKTIVLKRTNTDVSTAKKNSEPQPTPGVEEITVTARIPEVLVVGSRILNMDIPRTRDDAQPYVVFDRNTIERSGATKIEDFLQQRLPQNTVAGAFSQSSPSNQAVFSQINLRGLGTNQTLILIDGHRTNTIRSTGQFMQSDLNGIPLAAVERIEILPTTASGIYGGSATGGVVNVVLRRDYSGLESKLTYEDSFQGGGANRQVELSGGFNLAGGKTNILLTGVYSDAETLEQGQRDFVQRGRAALLANNPTSILSNAANATPLLGATTNIHSTTGANLVLDNGTPLNSPFTYLPAGYPGRASDDGAALVPNAGQYNLDLAETAASGRRIMAAAPTIESLAATIRHHFSDRVQAFLDLSAANNSVTYSPYSATGTSFTINANAPNNPFQQNIRVTAPSAAADSFLKTTSYSRRAVGGVIVQLPGNWTGEADYTWGRVRTHGVTGPGTAGLTSQATTDANNGTLDVLRDTMEFPLDLTAYFNPPNTETPTYSTLKDAALRFAGPVADLPGGAVTLSALIERREEDFSSNQRVFSALGIQQSFPGRSQSIDSAYLELRAPIVSARNAIAGARELELQLAGRHDEYTVRSATNFANTPVGSTTPPAIAFATNETSSTDPTIGLRYAPVRDVTLRASYGTGFLPPVADQLIVNPTLTTEPGGVNDPQHGGANSGPVQVRSGGNPDLHPEQSESWSAGIILTPRFLPGWRLSADYTRIEKRDNIQQLSRQEVVDNESILPGRVLRGPVSGIAACAGLAPDAICLVDTTFANVATTKVEAYDVALDFHYDTVAWGSFDFFSVATWQPHFETQLVPTVALVENAGIGGNFFSIPLKFKANAGFNWSYGPWTAGWAARYFHSYVVATNETTLLNQGGDGRVPSQIYHDFFASYRFGESSWAGGLLADTEFKLGIKNVFDEEPPFDAAQTAFFYSPFGDPRLASYYLSIRKSF